MWLTLCIPIMLLLSFTIQQTQNRGVKRVTKHLYSVNRTAVKNISREDQEEIKKLIVEHYGIKDLGQREIIVSATNPKNRASGGIFDNSIYKDWVSTRFIFWKNIKELPQEVTRANEIMTKYAAVAQ